MFKVNIIIKASLVFACVCILFSTQKGLAQIPDVGMQSPTAANLGKYGSTTIDMSKGALSLPIPIYTVNNSVVPIQINLSYDSRGVKVNDVPDWVGVNWALNAGGVITRKVNGIRDEISLKGYYEYGSNHELIDFEVFAKNFANVQYTGNQEIFRLKSGLPESSNTAVWDIMHNKYDSEPDEFNFNFNGRAGKFYLGYFKSVGDTVKAFTVPFSDLRIEFSIDNNTIQNFIITDESGLSYHFDEIEYSLYQSASNLPTTSLFPASWYLSKITSINSNEVVNFIYDNNSNNNNTVVHRYLDESYISSNTTSVARPNNEYENFIYTQFRRKYLKEINTEKEKILFIKSIRTNEGVHPVTNTPQEYQLDSIQVSSKNNVTNLFSYKKSFYLGYTEFGVNNNYNSKRKFLTELKSTIRNEETNSYKFDYYFPELLPPRNSFAIDHFGYYNGQLNNTTFFESSIVKENLNQGAANGRGYYYKDAADRSVDPLYNYYGLIKSIEYPTKGSVEIEYEPNTYSDLLYQNKDYDIYPYHDSIKGLSKTIKFSKEDIDITELLTTNSSSNNRYGVLNIGSITGISNYYNKPAVIKVRGVYVIDETSVLDFESISINSNEVFNSENLNGPSFAFKTSFYTSLTADLNITGKLANVNLNNHVVNDMFTIVLDIYVFESVNEKLAEGNRVHKIITKSSNSVIDIVEFEYENGVLAIEPNYVNYDIYYPISSDPIFMMRSFLSNGFRNNTGDLFLGYEKIKSINKDNSYTITNRKNKLNFISDLSTVFTDSTNNKLSEFINNNNYSNNVIATKSVSIATHTRINSLTPLSSFVGLEYSTQVFNSNNEELQRVEKRYNDYSNFDKSVAKKLKAFKLTNIGGVNEFIPYEIIIPNVQQFSDEVFIDNKPILKTEKKYAENTTQLVDETKYLSYKQIVQKNEYLNISNNNELNILHNSAKSKNVKNIVLNTKTYELIGSESTQIQKNLSKKYLVYDSQTTQIKKVINWVGDNSEFDISSVSVSSTNQIVGEVKSYNSYGKPLVVKAANNTYKHVVNSQDNYTTIGISNSENNTTKNYIHSFSYDGLTGWVKLYGSALSLTNENRLVFRNQINGTTWTEYKKSLGSLFTNADKVVFEFDFVASSFSNTNIEEFFFRACEYGISDSNGVQFHVKNGTFYTSIGSIGNDPETLLAGLEAGRTYSIKIIVDQSTDNADYYIDGIKRGSAIKLISTSTSEPLKEVSFSAKGNSQAAVNYYVDNFRMYKYGSQVQSAELSKLDGRITSLKSLNGLTSRFGYDSFGRLVDSRTESGPVTKQFYSYGNLINDASAAPYVETVVLSERRPIGVLSTLSWSNLNSTSFGQYLSGEDEYVIKQTNSSSNTNGTVALVQGEQFWVDVNLNKLNSGSAKGKFNIENANKALGFRYSKNTNTWEIVDSTGTSSISIPLNGLNKNGWFTLQFEFRKDGKFNLKVRERGGKLIADRVSNGVFLVSESVKVSTSVKSNTVDTVYLARPVLAKNVISTIEYTDGLGRPVQSHTVAADKRMVSATYLDGKGNAVASIKPVELNNQSGFLSFATVFGSTSWEPGQALSGSSVLKTAIGNAGYSADAAYAYSRTAFEKSPLNRVEKQFNPGESGLNSTTQVSSTYGINASAITFTALNVTFAANTLTFTTLTDQEGKSSTSYQDGLGREVLRVVDMDSNLLNVSNTDLVTLFEYDGLGNLLKSVDPKGLSTVYRYNPLGQLVSKKLPDMTDSVHYRYDNMGNLRFVQQPNHRLISPNANQTYYVNVPASPKNIQANGTHGILYLSMESFGDPIQTNVKEGDKTVASYLVASEELYSITSLVSSDVKVEVTNNENLTTIRYNPFKYTYNKYDEFGRITETGEYYGSTMFESAEANLSDFPTTDRQPLVKYYYDEKSAVSGANVSTGNLAKVEYFLNHDVSRKGITSYSYNSQGLVEWIKQEIPRGESAMLTSEIRYSYRDDGLLIKKQIVYGATNLYQWFYYDSFNRLVKASSNTSDNAEQATTDVDYSYDALGQLKAKVIRSGVQQVDYSYDIRGWLKAINDPNTIGTDKFAQSMVYMKNGNIGSISYSQPTVLSVPKLTFNYGYDNAGRLTSAYQSSTNMYKSTYSYDKNGNITKIGRAPQNEFIADLYLSYPSNSNRLEQIYDDEQGEDYSVSHDSQGNLIRNEKKGINSISYDGRNLAYLLVTSTGVHKYQQDGSGNRVIKDYNGTSVLYYLRDGEGRVQAVFNKDGQLLFWNLYAGSELLGKRNP